MKVKYGILSSILIVIDQITKKVVAANAAALNHKEIIHNFFYLTFAKNTGAAWSMFSNNTSILSIISLIVVIGLLYLTYVKTPKPMEGFCYSLLIAGAMGNFIDRFSMGYVIDFLDFYIFNYDYPIFNFADCCVTAGAFLLIYLVLKEDMHGKL